MKKFNWDLGCYCNFKCSYCFFSQAGWENLERLQGPPRTPDEIENAWKKVSAAYGTCGIYITGGEPFLYPGFVDIIVKIARYHRIHVTTNLSLPLDAFLEKADPQRVELNATFHPRHMELELFSRQLLSLHAAGFACGACYLAHPSQLREMLHYKRFLKEAGRELAITEFCGRYEAREFPAGYTPDEKSFIAYVDQWDSSHDDVRALGKWTRYSPTVENTCPPAEGSDNTFCRAGFDCADVSLDGTVRPCSLSPLRLGNLFEGSITLLEQSHACAMMADCRKPVGNGECLPNER
jgi:MoaA/NifB/PqqE/SkfB family radical SAM enzyme